jgi:hypothetical protein
MTTLKQFLDRFVVDALANPSKLVLYTEDMSVRVRDLIKGVEIDDNTIEIICYTNEEQTTTTLGNSPNYQRYYVGR